MQSDWGGEADKWRTDSASQSCLKKKYILVISLLLGILRNYSYVQLLTHWLFGGLPNRLYQHLLLCLLQNVQAGDKIKSQISVSAWNDSAFSIGKHRKASLSGEKQTTKNKRDSHFASTGDRNKMSGPTVKHYYLPNRKERKIPKANL